MPIIEYNLWNILEIYIREAQPSMLNLDLTMQTE